ncbi:MAG: M48 family metalloprotease [Armatimonadetes bacterium]|nr:M48 family metalloprotease [Armatimonadota bacterium]
MRRIWPWLVLCAVWSASAQPPPGAARAEGAPQVLRPDAKLPDRKVDASLGERRYSQKEEERGAKEVLAFYAKESRLSTDPRLQARLEGILHLVITAAAQLGPRQVCIDAATPELTFSIRVLESKDINAFSAWGGNIFLTRAMVDFCQSDDELGGVIAHEVAHTMYHHLRDQAARMRRYQTQQILAMIAASFMGINVADAGIMAQYVYLALFNGHSVTDESQADWAGCFYAYRAGYNPVGMITTFERLHRYMMSQPVPTDMGAFQTHPWSDQRARTLEAQIRALGLPIDKSDVTQGLTAMVRLDAAHRGQATLYLDDSPLFAVAAGSGGDSAERAARLAVGLNRAMALGVRAGSLSLREVDGVWRISGLARLRPVELLTLDPADAQLAGEPLATLAQGVFNRVQARCRQAEAETGLS